MNLFRVLFKKRIFYFAVFFLFLLSSTQLWARGGGGGHGGGGGFGGGGAHFSSGYGGGRYVGGSNDTDDTFFMFMSTILLLGLVAYFYQGTWKTMLKVRKVRAALQEMSKKDPEWDEEHLSQMIRHSFFEIQKAWCDLDMHKLETYLTPITYDHWNQTLKEFKRRDLHNLMDRLTINRIQLVSVRHPRHPEKPTITACIDAGAVDYFVDEHGKTLDYSERRMEKDKLPFKKFREFWTYEKEGPKTWKLYRVDQEDEWDRTVSQAIVNLD
jgi:Tim44-like domain